MTTQLNYRDELQSFQSARLRRDYADLAGNKQYNELAGFFFDELYGKHDLSSLQGETRRLGQFIHMMQGVTLRDIEQVLELLDLTARLDDDLANQLQQSGAPLPLDEAAYERAYRKANNYDLRLRQLDLLRITLQNVYHISHLPQVGPMLAQTSALAPMLGVRSLHAFLLKGYNAFSSIADVKPFSDAIYNRERALLDRIYGV